MTRGHRLSKDLRQAIIHMYRTCSIDDIIKYTRCKKRTIQRILHQHRTRSVTGLRYSAQEMRGRKRVLTGLDIHFLQGTVQHSPDIYLDELQVLLERRRGVIASISSIWRALKRSGYSMKKVCMLVLLKYCF
ncbi:hypothetical protein FPV67DRAFT_1416013 [Lyophyllum atratum]|nr:hypothetical protein FPV67DRAFT_1416013 [Lyophyllum atratum]